MVKLNTINSHFKGVKKSTMMNNFFFLFLPRYPHTFLKDEASPVRGSGFVVAPPNKCASWESNLCSHPCRDITVS